MLRIALTLVLASMCVVGLEVEVAADRSYLTIADLGPLPAEWLRERCLSPSTVDPDTKQPLKTPDAYPTPLVASAAMSSDDQSLLVTFTDGHESIFDIDFLLRIAMAEMTGPAAFAGDGALIQASEAEKVAVRPWDALSLGPLVTVEYKDLTAAKNSRAWLKARLAVFRALLETGIALIKGAPATEDQCKAMAASLSTLRVTE